MFCRYNSTVGRQIIRTLGSFWQKGNYKTLWPFSGGLAQTKNNTFFAPSVQILCQCRKDTQNSSGTAVEPLPLKVESRYVLN